jgi:hypothetical protein
VKTVLTGNLKVIGDTIALRIRLYDAEGSLLWGLPYSRELTDIFVMQEEIAEQLVEKLQLQLSGEERQQLASNLTENVAAAIAFRKGWDLYMGEGEKGLDRAIENFQRAIKLDSNFALAYFGLAQCYEWLCISDVEYCAKYRQAVERFIEIGRGLPEAYVAKGHLLAKDRDWIAAGEEFRKATYPNHYTPIFVQYLLWMGQLDQAAENMELHLQFVDPLSAEEHWLAAGYLCAARKYDRALEEYARMRELDPERESQRIWFLLIVYQGKGMEEETFSAFLSMQQDMESAEKLDKYRQTFEESGMQGVYLLWYEDAVKRSQAHKNLSEVAAAYSLAGEKDLAFEWLEKVYESRVVGFYQVFPVDARFDSLRSDARYEQLLRKLNLPEEAIQRHLAL